MPKFRRQPIVVEAEQFISEEKVPEGVYFNARYPIGGYEIKTLEGAYTVLLGDWIITGIKGEKYPCKPDIFEATYEEVDEYGDPSWERE